jgi:hypothetical protein
LSNFDIQKAIFGLTILGLSSILADSLVILSGFLGREDTKWLDDLEAKAIEDLKNSHSEGMSWEAELKVTEGAVAYLKFAIDQARARIVDAAKGG